MGSDTVRTYTATVQSAAVRRALAQDAEILTDLVHASSAYRGEYASIIRDYRVTAEYVARHRVFAAAEATGRVLGFYALVLDPPELDLAFVADAARGRGIGRLLVEHMLDQAGRAGLSDVRVVSHPPAEGFYRRLGAHRVGTIAPSPPRVTWSRPELRFTIA